MVGVGGDWDIKANSVQLQLLTGTELGKNHLLLLVLYNFLSRLRTYFLTMFNISLQTFSCKVRQGTDGQERWIKNIID